MCCRMSRVRASSCRQQLPHPLLLLLLLPLAATTADSVPHLQSTTCGEPSPLPATCT